jgi:hypothetical protein
MNFQITQIIPEEGNIKVIFDVDGVEQTIQAPLDNVDALNKFLFDYGVAYEAGLAKTAIVVAPEVEALVGQTYSLEQVTDAKTGIATLSSSMVAKGTLQKGS